LISDKGVPAHAETIKQLNTKASPSVFDTFQAGQWHDQAGAEKEFHGRFHKKNFNPSDISLNR
jgi:hypothetical protein